MKKLLILMCAVGLAGMACSHKDDPVAGAKAAAQDKDLISKNFTSACATDVGDAILTGFTILGYTTTYRFDVAPGPRVTRTRHLYSSHDCSGETAISLVEEGTYSLNPDQQTNDKGKSIDMDFKKLLVTTVNDEAVKAANIANWCGANDWSVNSKRDESAHAKDKNCLGTPLAKNVNIYRLDGDMLHLGAVSSDKRPASFAAGTDYKLTK